MLPDRSVGHPASVNEIKGDGKKGIPLTPYLSPNDLWALLKKRKTYFIIDDDIDDQEFLVDALVENNPDCQCITASNGQEAITNLTEALIPIPDVIFLDLNMPVLDGKQCLAIFKQTASLQNIPIIIYSTSSSKQEIHEMNQKGASYFLIKTHSSKELRKELASIPIMMDNDRKMA